MRKRLCGVKDWLRRKEKASIRSRWQITRRQRTSGFCLHTCLNGDVVLVLTKLNLASTETPILSLLERPSFGAGSTVKMAGLSDNDFDFERSEDVTEIFRAKASKSSKPSCKYTGRRISTISFICHDEIHRL